MIISGARLPFQCQKQAQDMALTNLIEKIEVTVQSSFEITTSETQTSERSNFLESSRDMVQF